jgi:type VI secretion system secreted protein Hcp
MSRFRLLAVGVVASVIVVFGLAATANAADYFLEVDGVQGESRDDAEANSIDVLSFSWGASAGTDKKGTPRLQDFNFTHRVDAASPVLFQRLVQGTNIPSAELIGRKAGGREQIVFLRWCFQDVKVSSVQQGGSGGSSENPTEQVSFAYGSASQQYTTQRADGSADGTVFAGWNAVQGALITTYPTPCGGR